MLINDNAKMAWTAVKSARWRSLLTMLGIIIGVAAVITSVSLGEGLKRQVKQQVGSFGSDLITVRPGQTIKRDANGKVISVDLLSALGTGSLGEPDWSVVAQTPDVASSAPLSLLPSTLDVNGRQTAITVIATAAGLPDTLHQKLAYGSDWGDNEETKNIAVLGKNVAQTVFGDNAPIGQAFRLRGQNFLVRGVFEQFAPNPLLPTVDFNRVVFIPYGAAKNVLGTPPAIAQIVAKPRQPEQLDEVVSHLTINLLSAHGGQADFTVLKQAENTLPTNALVHAITQVVVGIAAVSVILGGVGIMNVMLVAVTERTREIGIRKAIGATNRQILSQFMVEAAVISLGGAALGVMLAFLAEVVIRLLTALEPVIPFWIVMVSVGISVGVGLLFGTVPALQAARKDPIEALRYE